MNESNIVFRAPRDSETSQGDIAPWLLRRVRGYQAAGDGDLAKLLGVRSEQVARARKQLRRGNR